MPDLFTLLTVIVIVAVVLWLFVRFVPMPEPYKQILVVLVSVVVLLWLARWLLT